MKDLLKRVSGTIARHGMLQEQESVLAAVSGGADSVCLLIALHELGYRVSAVHVEHGIRGADSMEDCAFVQDLCMAKGIPLTVRHIDVPSLAARSGRSVEEAARDARYEILSETARSLGISVIATAHHRGDQAETVLWNLIRGSALAGLCGILPVREMASAAETVSEKNETQGLRLIRPLLETDRKEIEEWLTERGQPWRTDRTNLDPSITRNAIRLQILPSMERLNPAAGRHIAQAADDLARIRSYLDDVTSEAYGRCVRSVRPSGHRYEPDEPDETCELQIDLHVLRTLPQLIAQSVLHRVIGEAAGTLRDIGREHVESLMALAGMDNGRRISLPQGLVAVREEGIIAIRRGGDWHRRVSDAPAVEIPAGCSGTYSIDGCGTVEVCFGIWEGGPISKKKYTKTLAYDTMIPYITLRTRKEGDWLVVNSEGGRRKLKDYLIDEKIPRDRRDEILLIAQESHVLWVVGHRISEAARVSEGAHYAEITVTCPGGHEEPKDG